MKTTIIQLLVCLGLTTAIGYASQDRKANALFVEAYQLVKEAQELEKTSYSHAFKLYADSFEKLEIIISKYPYSQIAVDLVQGKSKVGPYTMDELETIMKQLETKAYAEQDIFAYGIVIAKSIEEAEDRAEALAEIAEECLESNQYYWANEALNSIDIENLESNFKEELIFFKIGINSLRYAEAGQYDQAIDAANRIENSETKDWFLAEIAKKSAENGAYAEALDLANTIENSRLKAEALSEIATKYIQRGQKDEAFMILSKALRIANKIVTDWKKPYALERIATKYAQLGEHDEAVRVANTIENSQYKNRTLANIASKCAEDGEYDKALGAAKMIQHPWLRSRTLAEIAHNYTVGGQRDEASMILYQAINITDTLDHNSEVLAEIAVKYAEAGQEDKALGILSEVLEDAKMERSADSRAKSLAKIARKYVEVGHKDEGLKIFSQALQVANTLPPGYYSNVLEIIANLYVGIGEYDRALQVANRIRKDATKVRTLLEIAGKYVEAGQNDNASDIFYVALKVANTVVDPSNKSERLAEIASSYHKAGQKLHDRIKSVLHEGIKGVD